MLLELALWLGQDIRGFNVFGYITLRTVLAALTALVISLVAGPGVFASPWPPRPPPGWARGA